MAEPNRRVSEVETALVALKMFKIVARLNTPVSIRSMPHSNISEIHDVGGGFDQAVSRVRHEVVICL